MRNIVPARNEGHGQVMILSVQVYEVAEASLHLGEVPSLFANAAVHPIMLLAFNSEAKVVVLIYLFKGGGLPIRTRWFAYLLRSSPIRNLR